MKALFLFAAVVALAMAASLPKDMMCSISGNGTAAIKIDIQPQPIASTAPFRMFRVNGYARHDVLTPLGGIYATMIVRPDINATGTTLMYINLMGDQCIAKPLSINLDMYALKVKEDDLDGYGFEYPPLDPNPQYKFYIYFDENNNLKKEYIYLTADMGAFSMNLTYENVDPSFYIEEEADDTFIFETCDATKSQAKDALSSKCEKTPSPKKKDSESAASFVLPSIAALLLALALFF